MTTGATLFVDSTGEARECLDRAESIRKHSDDDNRHRLAELVRSTRKLIEVNEGR